MTESERRILVISTSRGDACGLRNVHRELAKSTSVRLIATDASVGFHIAPAEADTVIDCRLVSAATPSQLARAGSKLVDGLCGALDEWRPDIAVVMGDRHELLAVARCLLLYQVPFAHLDGGVVTEGAFDDSIRHALSKLAAVHLCSSEAAAARLRQLGEEGSRIFVVGEPALDDIVERAQSLSKIELAARLGFELNSPLALVTYHPPTTSMGTMPAELEAIIDAVLPLPTVVATPPAAEPGSESIKARFLQIAAVHPTFHVVESLGELYPAVALNADVIVGNSSSGVIESTVLGTPAVNVGDRESGRPSAGNIIDARTPDKVADAVAVALDPGRRNDPSPPDEPSARRIAEILTRIDTHDLFRKKFVDVK